MNRLTILFATLAALAPLLSGSDPERRASLPVASPPLPGPAPDSVRVLLFPIDSPEEILLLSTRPVVVGNHDRTRRLTLRAENGVVLLDGHGERRFGVRGESAMRLVSGTRERSTTGRLEFAADGNRLVVVAHVPLRDYLAGALVSESERNDPVEYLAALSVLQRNYVASHRGRHAPLADLCDNTHCQRFSLQGAAGAIYTAVDRGSSIALSAAEALPCYYSVNCGGETLTPLEVWRRDEPGYSGVICGSCRASRWHRWTRTIRSTPTVERIMREAPVAPFIDDDFKIRAGRAFGFNIVLSNTVDRISRRGGVYHVEGRGFGHRVGLCQDGARALARSGRSAVEILRHYFPRTTLRSPR